MMRAAWLLAVCACGDGIAVPDAVVPDADDDRGVVEVRLVNHDRFRSTAVYFQERDSTLALATRLDANGFARGYLHAHGFVTVIDDRGDGITPIYTYSNVSPGDKLVIDPIGTQTIRGNAFIRLQIPSLPETESYVLETSCNTTDVSMARVQPILVDLSGCGTQTDLLVVAHAPAGDVYIFENEVALSEPAPVIVSLQARTYQAYEAATLNIVGLAANVPYWFAARGILLGPRVSTTFGDVLFPIEGTASFETFLPAADGMTAYIESGPAHVNGDPALELLEQVYGWRPASPSITIDVRDYNLREQTAPARYLPEASSIVWSEAADGLVPQATIARMQWSAPETLYQWAILGKRDDEPRLALPILPRPNVTPDPRSPPYELFRFALLNDAGAAVDRLLGRGQTWEVVGESGTVVWQMLSQQY